MNFHIVYNGITIENFTAATIEEGKKYVRARYRDNGKGCDLIWYVNGEERKAEL
jgi:hypothetical protein